MAEEGFDFEEEESARFNANVTKLRQLWCNEKVCATSPAAASWGATRGWQRRLTPTENMQCSPELLKFPTELIAQLTEIVANQQQDVDDALKNSLMEKIEGSVYQVRPRRRGRLGTPPSLTPPLPSRARRWTSTAYASSSPPT